jgi:hypothetical protein
VVGQKDQTNGAPSWGMLAMLFGIFAPLLLAAWSVASTMGGMSARLDGMNDRLGKIETRLEKLETK